MVNPQIKRVGGFRDFLHRGFVFFVEFGEQRVKYVKDQGIKTIQNEGVQNMTMHHHIIIIYQSCNVYIIDE